ncbi:MAG: PHP domain-containing protein [Anaerolineae bacterium]|nr:PHP domain-containing protein [Anaerolineae bacterium]
MQNNHYNLNIMPKIVPIGKESTLTLFPPPEICDLETCQVSVFPVGGAAQQTTSIVGEPLLVHKNGATLQVQYTFSQEQEYVFWVTTDSSTPVGEFRVYALEDELFALRPYKGDLHIHSDRSDGKEPPAYVAGAARRIGLDFMAVTDHRRYTPSLEAIQAYNGVSLDLRIYPGEEVHPPGNPVHIINFGGRFSINDLMRTEDAAYHAAVQVIADNLLHFPPDVDRYTYASCVWCFDKIREGGGLGIFCHPYWFSRHRYDIPEYLTTQLLEHQPFDALELIGGYHPFEVESNMLQVARYHEERARGKIIPIVGVSDAHGCETGELFGWYYTIVFAPSPNLPDLIESVKTLNAVAVEALPDQTPRAHGPFRLVRYAQFLLREVFPHHDALCEEEGKLMLIYSAGDETAAANLRACQGQTTALYSQIWAKS